MFVPVKRISIVSVLALGPSFAGAHGGYMWGASVWGASVCVWYNINENMFSYDDDDIYLCIHRVRRKIILCCVGLITFVCKSKPALYRMYNRRQQRVVYLAVDSINIRRINSDTKTRFPWENIELALQRRTTTTQLSFYSDELSFANYFPVDFSRIHFEWKTITTACASSPISRSHRDRHPLYICTAHRRTENIIYINGCRHSISAGFTATVAAVAVIPHDLFVVFTTISHGSVSIILLFPIHTQSVWV